MAKANPISVAFGKAIKKERIQQGITQLELAERCDLDTSYISRIERGLKNPTLSVVWEISDNLGMNLISLITVTVQNLPHPKD